MTSSDSDWHVRHSPAGKQLWESNSNLTFSSLRPLLSFSPFPLFTTPFYSPSNTRLDKARVVQHTGHTNKKPIILCYCPKNWTCLKQVAGRIWNLKQKKDQECNLITVVHIMALNHWLINWVFIRLIMFNGCMLYWSQATVSLVNFNSL